NTSAPISTAALKTVSTFSQRMCQLGVVELGVVEPVLDMTNSCANVAALSSFNPRPRASFPRESAHPMSAPPLDNPLLEHWATPFAVPPFSRIASEHFQPAFAAPPP